VLVALTLAGVVTPRLTTIPSFAVRPFEVAPSHEAKASHRDNFPSPSGRELEGGAFHPHLNPLPSRARNLIRDYAVDYSRTRRRADRKRL